MKESWGGLGNHEYFLLSSEDVAGDNQSSYTIIYIVMLAAAFIIHRRQNEHVLLFQVSLLPHHGWAALFVHSSSSFTWILIKLFPIELWSLQMEI